jgi:antitoxin ParD1/3/4
MPTIEKLSIALPAEMAALVRRAVDGGEYSSNSEVIRDALRDWTHKRNLKEHGLSGLRKAWQEAVADDSDDLLIRTRCLTVWKRSMSASLSQQEGKHLRLSRCVSADLEAIAEYIALDSPRHAIRMLRLLRTRMKQTAKQPVIYRLRPEIGAEARLATLWNDVILFSLRQDSVRIERVVHGGRDLVAILKQTEI